MIPSRILSYAMLPVPGLIIGSCMSENQKVKPELPNVIIILSDDQGWGDLSINGNTNLQTPNIDHLAKTGAQFNNFFVCPVSSPTRAELLTGRYHNRCGVYSTSEGGERLNLDETTIAEVFKRAGYVTAAFGKWHNGMQYPYHPNARGFDEFYGFCSGHWGDYFSPQLLDHNGEIVQGSGFITDDLTERAMAYIANNSNKPFLLYIPYNTPHSPMQVPDLWWDKFKEKEIEMLADNPSKEDINFTRAALAMCENIDWNVGRILQKLSELNLADNTIVLYLSDNGPNKLRWNGGMKGIKASTDEGGVRSPLIISWPGKIDPGKKIEEIAGAIDLLPTLADMAGIECKTLKPPDGLSLKPLLMEKKPDWNERLIYSSWNGRVSVRSQQYRLDSQGNLFDMIADHGQKRNISPDKPEMVSQLKESMEKWKTDVNFNRSGDERRFPVGHPDCRYTQLPARDGRAHGNIKRSNKFPNSSFFTEWTSLSDSITWDAEVLTEGNYEAVIYYTCSEKNVGSEFCLSFGENKLVAKITEAHDPPLRGMENDRAVRENSYIKDFKPFKAGIIHLPKGAGRLTLQALVIPGRNVMDLRMLVLIRAD